MQIDQQAGQENYTQVALYLSASQNMSHQDGCAQDAHAAVRQKFGQKVARCVEVFCRPAWGNVRAGKYAAMLPLAAMDPLHESQQVRCS